MKEKSTNVILMFKGVDNSLDVQNEGLNNVTTIFIRCIMTFILAFVNGHEWFIGLFICPS